MSHSDSPLSGRLVHVFTATTIPEGLLARSRLEAEDIPVMVKGESEGPYRLGPVYLWVPEELEVQARLILAEVTSRHDGSNAAGNGGRAEGDR
jgi:hypothetical protein